VVQRAGAGWPEASADLAAWAQRMAADLQRYVQELRPQLERQIAEALASLQIGEEFRQRLNERFQEGITRAEERLHRAAERFQQRARETAARLEEQAQRAAERARRTAERAQRTEEAAPAPPAPEEQRLVLEMLREGRLTVEQAARLLEALG